MIKFTTCVAKLFLIQIEWQGRGVRPVSKIKKIIIYVATRDRYKYQPPLYLKASQQYLHAVSPAITRTACFCNRNTWTKLDYSSHNTTSNVVQEIIHV